MNPKARTAALFFAAIGLFGMAVGLSPHLLEKTDTPDPTIKLTPISPIVLDEGPAPLVQIALLLDTSSSMDGLIGQAKAQLWKVVNDLAEAKRNGRNPRLEIALFEYGNSNLPATEGYIRRISSFTEELDGVSEQLFSLTTNGGEEFAGQVIEQATETLEWSKDDSLKLIFIAGNESFNQGSIPTSAAIAQASQRGIGVNTIYCGSEASAEARGWQRGAALADGSFMTINQNYKVAHIAAPQDKEIAQLGSALNNTYIPFGARGGKGMARQKAQDYNANTVGVGTVVNRSISKASGLYSNYRWDLVDATNQKKVNLDAVAEEQLPANMRSMSQGERSQYVQGQAEKRVKIQKKIKKLNAQRKRYVAKQRRQQADAQESSLDSAMIDSVRKQASEKGYKF